MDRRKFLLTAAAAGFATVGSLEAGKETTIKNSFRLDVGHQLPDPFCIRWQDAWYLTGTHSTRRSGNGPLYDMYRSTDLHCWTHLGPILEFPVYEGSDRANYWAPELLAHQGKFYLYYTADSNGDPFKRYVRLAVADSIDGPYRDQGLKLTAQPSIDANPNWTAGGEGWMFFTGNEGNEHVGQILVDRLISPGKPAGEARKVFPDETVSWEEGAFLVPHAGRYYLFTSMGNWRDGSYHLLLSVAERPQGPFVRLTDEEDSPLVILKSHAGRLGPGHNSVFQGPDGVPYICFHAWDQEHTGRYPYVAPLKFKGGRFEVEL